jgi:hypothetical protein
MPALPRLPFDPTISGCACTCPLSVCEKTCLNAPLATTVGPSAGSFWSHPGARVVLRGGDVIGPAGTAGPMASVPVTAAGLPVTPAASE